MNKRSLRELRKIHKTTHKEIIKVGYHIKYLAKPLSLFLLKLLVYTPLTGNQVTLAMLILGIIGSLFVGFDSLALWGGIILQFTILLDCIDGSLARFRNQESRFGRYLDGMFHSITMPLLFFMLGVYSYKYFNNLLFIFLGFTTAFSMVVTQYVFLIRIYLLSSEKKIPQGHEGIFLAARFRKNMIQKIIGQAIVTINRFSYIFTLVLIAKIFNFLQYLIFFYFPFYVLVMIIKIFIEFKIAKKELS